MNIKVDKLIPAAQGHYVIARRHGDLIFSSGMTPRQNGQLLYTGPIRTSESIFIYRDAVTLACENAVSAIKQLIHENEKLGQVLNMNVFIATEPNFQAHSQLADFASEYLHTQFGDAGIGSRAAIGVSSLPGQAPIEIQITAAVSTH